MFNRSLVKPAMVGQKVIKTGVVRIVLQQKKGKTKMTHDEAE